MRHTALEHTLTHVSTPQRGYERRSEIDGTRAHQKTFTALWSTLSGFESLPPSRIPIGID